jgi:hypothetical protein
MTKIASLVLILSTLSVGCGTASMVRPDARGGRIELDGGYMPSMSEARVLMAEHCGGRYDVHEEAAGGAVEFTCRRDIGSLAAR